jgi:UTP--glucose-1-phosphate uridylyltransferase
MDVTTAVIPVAGIGTRTFPMTTVIEKCLLPVYAGSFTRPLVDYMVADCIGAGINRIIFVTSERGRNQLVAYFSNLDDSLVAQLRYLGKDDILQKELERRRNLKVTIEYIIQPTGAYGTAIPLYLAKPLLSSSHKFIMMGGDDFIYHPDGTSELALALEEWERLATTHMLMGIEVTREQAIKYGVLQINEQGLLNRIDEKPPLSQIPERPRVNITRYLLSDTIWTQIDAEIAQELNGQEHYITRPITNAIQSGQTFGIHTVVGTYLDGGTFDGLSAAGSYIQDHPPSLA